MESIIQNCPEKLDFVVIYYDLNKETQDILSKHFKEKVKSLEFYEVDKETISQFENVKNVPHIHGLNVFLRLLIDKILPESDKYVIYLDCDIIVQDNILKIADGVNLDKPICAVTEYNPAYKWQYLSLSTSIMKEEHPWMQEAYWYRAYQSLKMDATANYFNAGVMVINLEYWRKHKIAEKAITFLLNNPEKCYAADQDALNHAVNGNYCALAPQWNTVAKGVFSGYTEQQLRKAHEDPFIIHAAGGIKPWHYRYTDPKVKKLYKQYRRFTPYPEVSYADKNLKNILKYQIILLLKLIMQKKIRVIRQNLMKESPRSKIRIKL
jgi:lipopolysaccharide biosynthesis glycosyltransferase